MAEKEIKLEMESRMNMTDRQKRALREGRVLSSKSERDKTYNENMTWDFERTVLL